MNAPIAPPAGRSPAGTLTAVLVGLAAVALTAIALGRVLPLGELYLWKVLTVSLLMARLLVRSSRSGHPHRRFGPANTVTTARGFMVALATGFIGEAVFPVIAATAVAVGLVVMLLDGVDGWLARRTGMASPFGGRFDVEVDAWLIQVLALLVFTHGKAGIWIVTAGLLRYVFVAAGRRWDWMRGPLPRSERARVICVLQIVALIAALAPVVVAPWSALIAGAGLLALGYSFLVDTLWLWRHARLSSTG